MNPTKTQFQKATGLSVETLTTKTLKAGDLTAAHVGQEVLLRATVMKPKRPFLTAKVRIKGETIDTSLLRTAELAIVLRSDGSQAPQPQDRQSLRQEGLDLSDQIGLLLHGQKGKAGLAALCAVTVATINSLGGDRPDLTRDLADHYLTSLRDAIDMVVMQKIPCVPTH